MQLKNAGVLREELSQRFVVLHEAPLQMSDSPQGNASHRDGTAGISPRPTAVPPADAGTPDLSTRDISGGSL